MPSRIVPFILALTLVACASQREPFQAHTASLPYRLLRPDPAAGPGPHPLIVIFHGSGAIGNDNRAQIGPVAKSWVTAEMRRRFPAYVLIPQFPARSANYTPGADGLPVSHGTPLLAAALELVRDVRAKENVSETYAIGWSMGGSALWNALAAQPGLFSRAVIVGGVPPADALRAAGSARVLLVHGDQDTENPFDAARRVHEASRGTIELWRYPGLGHEFPPDLIATPRMAEWLLGR